MSAEASRAVFLSYASQDAEPARRICEALRRGGVEVWFDQNELVGGDAWDAKIRKQIAECALFVPLISANTQARLEGYFRIEWKLAARRTHAMATAKAFLLPIVIDGTRDADAHVPDEFREVQWTRLPGGEASEKFRARVKVLLGGETPVVAGVADPGPASAFRPDSGQARPATPQRVRSWLTPALAVVAALAGIAFLVLSRKAAPASSEAPVVENAPAAGAQSARVSPVARVAAMLRQTDISRTELELASNLLEQAAKTSPANAEIFAQWALVDCRFLDEYYDRSAGRLEAMRQHAAQAASLAPAAPATRLARVMSMRRLLHNTATRAEAATLLRGLLTEIPADVRVPLELGAIAVGSRQDEEAREWYARAARLPGGAGVADYERSFTYLRKRGYGEMLAAIESALTHEHAVKFLLWKSYLQVVWLGDMAAARQTLAEVPAEAFVEDMPASARSFVAYWSRDYATMLAAMKAVPREFMESMALTIPTGYDSGLALARLGRPAAAEAEWQAALAVVERRLADKPRDASLLRCKAALLAHLGDRAAAEKVRRTLHELAGEDVSDWMEEDLAVQVLTKDQALDRLEAQMKTNRGWLTAATLRLAPYLDPLRAEPRFAELQAKADADPRLSPTATRNSPVAPTAEFGGEK